MLQYGLPVLFALFVWWFSTGLIIYLDGLPRSTFRWSMIGATALLAFSLSQLPGAAADTSVAGAYRGFTYGMLAWGWQEISFYLGYVTGPRPERCAPGCAGWRHFLHALEVSLYHEIAIAVTAAFIVITSWGEPNQVATWTFLVLWWMHESARLNVFLGVRNVSEQFVPAHLDFLKSFLRKRPMNLLFPFSVTLSTVALVMMVQKAITPGLDHGISAGIVFVATMMGLAIIEHWVLVLPLPFDALWSWSLESRNQAPKADAETVSASCGCPTLPAIT
jgi:putative photosynthetic complex assembly protein 2